MWLRRVGMGLAVLALVPQAAYASATLAPMTVAVAQPAYSGDPLGASLSVRNRGKAARHVAVTLALLPAAGGSKITLPRVTIARIKARFTLKIKLNVKVGAPAGGYVLVACIGGSCARSKAFTLRPPTPAFDRLSSDLAAGRLTPGKAALYEFLALTGSSKLPAAYRTPTRGPDTLGTLAIEHWNQLSNADKAAIVPYLLPPRYADSYWNPGHPTSTARTRRSRGPLRRGLFDSCANRPAASPDPWTAVPATHGVVWYAKPADETLAGNLAGELDAIWTKLVSSDGLAAPKPDTSCDPTGDGRLDVYLVGPAAFKDASGAVIPGIVGGQTFRDGCGATSATILLSDARPPDQAAWSLAHEFFHAEQVATGASCNQPSGWIEGSADWAKDEVYPHNPDPHGHVLWSRNPLQPLRDVSYDGWPFWYWLAHDQGVAAVGKVLASIGSAGFDTSVREAPGGDFTHWFGLFGEAFWNKEPIGEPGITVARSFDALDGYATPATATALTLTEGGSQHGPNKDTYRTSASVASLGMRYLDLTVGAGVGQIEVANGYADTAAVAVRLLADTDSGWEDVDLTTTPNKTFCFNHTGEKISRAVLVIANASLAASARNVDLIVHGKCDPEVTFSGTADCLGDCLAMGQVQVHWDWSGSAKLLPSPENGFPGSTVNQYTLDTGSMTVHLRTVNLATGCIAEGTKTVTVGTGSSGGDSVEITLIDQPPTYEISAVLANLETVTLTYSGCDPTPQPGQFPLGGMIYLTAGSQPVARDAAATTISGSYDPPVVPNTTDLTRHYTYTLTGV